MGRAFEKRKAKKFARWSKLAKIFTRIGKEIAIAAKEGGPDVGTNARLRVAVQNAKGVNMPKDRIEAAIKRATSKDASNYEEIVYEGYGQHGIAVLVECASDNTIRTVANVRSYFRKCGGSLGKTGSLDFLFTRKCVFKIKAEGIELEELEFELIDHGLDEIQQDTDVSKEGEEFDVLLLFGAFTDFGNLQKALEERNIEAVSSELQRVPHTTKELTDEQVDDVEKLIDMLEEDDDVQQVFHDMS